MSRHSGAGGAGAGVLSAVGTDGLLSCLLWPRQILESMPPVFSRSLPGHNPFFPKTMPTPPPLPSCDRMISPHSLNTDLFHNKTRCVQGQPSDVADAIVLHKSGTDTDLGATMERVIVRKKTQSGGGLKTVDWHYAFEIIFDQSEIAS